MKVTLKKLTKVFENKKDKTETTAVDHIDVEIPSGKLIGLLGPSGCGKSTTLFMISGLHSVSEGEIWFDNENVTKLAPEKRGIGLVFQNYALYPHMTVAQNIMFPLENLKIPKAEAKKKAQRAADLVQIGKLMDRKPAELSGGQQQRVAIARALVKTPRVLLLDEPLSNLDARLRLQTREEIKRIQRETGITTIFVTHDQEEALSISDEIVVMDYGVVKQVGHPQEVYNNPDNEFVARFMGTPPINMFKGKIEDNKIIVGNDTVGTIKSTNNMVSVGIRPEGFEIDEKNGTEYEVDMIENIGRDTMLIMKHSAAEKGTFRAILDSDLVPYDIKSIKLSVKPNKLFVFDASTQDRIRSEEET